MGDVNFGFYCVTADYDVPRPRTHQGPSLRQREPGRVKAPARQPHIRPAQGEGHPGQTPQCQAPTTSTIVDRSLQSADGKIVVALIRYEFTVKTLKMRNGRTYLDPANADYSVIEVTPERECEVRANV